MKKENRRKENHNEKTNHNGRTNRNDKDTRAMRSSGNTMTPHKTLWHPISTPIFIFYTIMSAINGSASLMLLGTAAAFGAWILEEIFMATSGPAQSGKCFRHRRDRKDSDVSGAGLAQSGKHFSHRIRHSNGLSETGVSGTEVYEVSGSEVSCSGQESYTGSRHQMFSHPGELLSMSNPGRIVFLRKRAS